MVCGYQWYLTIQCAFNWVSSAVSQSKVIFKCDSKKQKNQSRCKYRSKYDFVPFPLVTTSSLQVQHFATTFWLRWQRAVKYGSKNRKKSPKVHIIIWSGSAGKDEMIDHYQNRNILVTAYHIVRSNPHGTWPNIYARRTAMTNDNY